MIMVIVLTLLITIIMLIIVIILFTILKRKCLQINDLVSALSAAECESAQSTIEV